MEIELIKFPDLENKEHIPLCKECLKKGKQVKMKYRYDRIWECQECRAWIEKK